MPAALLPANEADRLRALRDLDVLDTPPDDVFDRFVKATAAIMAVPIVAISLVDRSRQWFKASTGLSVSETSRDVSFCAHAILSPDDIMHVRDATEDARFADNPLVTAGPRLRAYVGAPILKDGLPIGVLCAIDCKPRDFDPEQLLQLRNIARVVATTLKLSSSVKRLGQRGS